MSKEATERALLAMLGDLAALETAHARLSAQLRALAERHGLDVSTSQPAL